MTTTTNSAPGGGPGGQRPGAGRKQQHIHLDVEHAALLGGLIAALRSVWPEQPAETFTPTLVVEDLILLAMLQRAHVATIAALREARPERAARLLFYQGWRPDQPDQEGTHE